MQRMIESLIVTLTGIVIVFFGLVILIGLIKLLVKATQNMGKKEKKPKKSKAAEKKPEPAPAPEAPASQPAEENCDDDALIAVIAAAVACMMEDGSAFTVRRIRRVNNTPAWQKAGREEQIYSRF